MPKLPSWKHHAVSFGTAAGESVSTNSPRRMTRAETARIAKETKERFESLFPDGFTAEDYANVLIRKCVALPPGERSSEADSTIRKFLSLERLSYSFSLPERAEFFRQAKRSYVSRLLQSVLPKLKSAEYREANLEKWSQWFYAKWFADIGDFWFWNGWRDRFFAEGNEPCEDLPISI